MSSSLVPIGLEGGGEPPDFPSHGQGYLAGGGSIFTGDVDCSLVWLIIRNGYVIATVASTG